MTNHNPNNLSLVTTAILISLAHLSCASLEAAETGYHLLGEVPIDDPTGCQVLTVEEATRCLYAVTRSNIFILHLENRQLTKQFTNTVGIQSFIPMPAFQRAFYLKRHQSGLNIVALDTLKGISKVGTGRDPVSVLIGGGLGYVLNAGDRTVTMFEPDDGDFMGTIELPGAPRLSAVDEKSAQVFCSVPEKNLVVILDISKRGNLPAWSTLPGEKPAGLVFEPAARRLIAGCGNNLLVLMDPGNGKVIDSLTIDSGAETLALDPGNNCVFATGGKGIITLIHASPTKLTATGTLKVPPESRCLAVDSKTHQLYLGAGDQPKILIYGQ